MKRYVVTGGGGFVGGAICRALRARGDAVATICRGDYPDLSRIGVQIFRADLGSSPELYRDALRGAEAVFHVAAKVEMWGRYQDFFRANVIATRNLLQLCRELNVPKFIFTSSPSVIADGTNLCGIDESHPYPSHYLANYPKTKAIAEREVLAGSGVDGAPHTIALRPHLIWGPGDHNFVPTIIERARSGRLVQVGNGTNRVDLSYIDDCVQAHLKAEAALDRTPGCRGKAYFITQGEPVELWSWINQVLQRHGLPPVTRKIPAWLGFGAAALCELVSLIRPGRPEPLLTRFLASEMSTSHYFSIAAAKRDLGYIPEYTIAAAMEATFGGSSAKAQNG